MLNVRFRSGRNGEMKFLYVVQVVMGIMGLVICGYIMALLLDLFT